MRLLVVSLLFVAGISAVGGPAASASATAGPGIAVPILPSGYGAPRIDVLAGDTVTWRNGSVFQHTVAATDGSFASGRLASSASFSHRFDAPGTVLYYCQVHPTMRGKVEVHTLMLTSAPKDAPPGRPFQLAGRTALPAGSAVSIEADDGTGPKPAATATVESDGTFRATVAQRTTTTFRAVAGDALSPPVRVRVLDRRVSATAGGHGRRAVVKAHVLPASPGATVVLQLHLRERFGWWPVRRARVDGHSTVRFPVRLARRVRARVVLTLPDGATPLSVSPTLLVGPRR
jgi:plastocyanin